MLKKHKNEKKSCNSPQKISFGVLMSTVHFSFSLFLENFSPCWSSLWVQNDLWLSFLVGTEKVLLHHRRHPHHHYHHYHRPAVGSFASSSLSTVAVKPLVTPLCSERLPGLAAVLLFSTLISWGQRRAAALLLVAAVHLLVLLLSSLLLCLGPEPQPVA